MLPKEIDYGFLIRNSIYPKNYEVMFNDHQPKREKNFRALSLYFLSQQQQQQQQQQHKPSVITKK